MKKIQKIMALVLALVMCMAMSSVAFAEDTTYTIAIKNDVSGYTYSAYQIFTGELSDGILSNVQWGNGISDAGKAALRTKYSLTAITDDAQKDARQVAEAIAADTATDKADAIATLLAKTTTNGLGTAIAMDYSDTVSVNNQTFKGYATVATQPAGWYLVVNSAVPSGATDTAYSDYIVQVVNDVAIAPKSVTTTSDKQVADNDSKDSTTGDTAKTTSGTTTWGETADHAINEPFQFKLTATIPADAHMADYETYAITFKDTFSKGITFEKIDSVIVTSNNVEYTVTEGTGDAEYAKTLTQSTASDGGTLDIAIKDVKKLEKDSTKIDLTNGATITVLYTAHLNENAIVTKASMDTSSDALNKNDMYVEYSNNPNGSGTGKTVTDNVWVFTYKVDTIKVAGDQKTTTTLTNEQIAALTFNSSDIAVASDGTVYLREGTSPDYTYSTLAKQFTDVKFSIKNGNTVIKFVKNTDGSYSPIADQDETDTAKYVTELTSTDGNFNIKGLDEGTYTLEEVAWPTGYNKADDQTITVTAEKHEETDGGTKAKVTMTNIDDTTVVVNQKGTTLPSTGGIGTTIFYVIGAVLVLGAGILLVTRRRMNVQ